MVSFFWGVYKDLIISTIVDILFLGGFSGVYKDLIISTIVDFKETLSRT